MAVNRRDIINPNFPKFADPILPLFQDYIPLDVMILLIF